MEVVGPTALVTYDTCRYSMPPEAMGLSGTLYLGEKDVRVIAGRWSADHPRLFVPHAKSVLPVHRVAFLAAVSGKRGRNYAKREQLFDLGAELVEFITELVHRRPNRWFDDVDRLHELLGLHGDRALVVAVQRALAQRQFGAAYVAHHLGDLDRMQRLVFVSGAAQ